MDMEKLKEKIRIAKDAVKNEEDDLYKVAIFQVILQKLLNDDLISDSSHVQEKSKRSHENSNIQIDKNLVEKIEIAKIQYLKSLTSVLDKCLALLSYLSENFRHNQGLTTDELKEIFAEKFGLTTITLNNISMSLKNVTGKYVTRTRISDKTEKYRYQILEKGNKYIKERIAKVANSDTIPN